MVNATFSRADSHFTVIFSYFLHYSSSISSENATFYFLLFI